MTLGGGALLLLLADGRFPGGGHAHSGGLEAAVSDGSVCDEATLRAFLHGRLLTSGPTEAWFAAEACRIATAAAEPATDHGDDRNIQPLGPGETSEGCVSSAATVRQQRLQALADRYEARTPSAAQRAAARTLGRGLRRVIRGMWPDAPRIDVEPYPVVLGMAAAIAGLDPIDAARIAVHNLLTGAATAAPKLFAIDMVDAMRATAGLTRAADAAVAAGSCTPAPPPRSALLTELRAEAHAAWDVRLFAS